MPVLLQNLAMVPAAMNTVAAVPATKVAMMTIAVTNLLAIAKARLPHRRCVVHRRRGVIGHRARGHVNRGIHLRVRHLRVHRHGGHIGHTHLHTRGRHAH